MSYPPLLQVQADLAQVTEMIRRREAGIKSEAEIEADKDMCACGHTRGYHIHSSEGCWDENCECRGFTEAQVQTPEPLRVQQMELAAERRSMGPMAEQLLPFPQFRGRGRRSGQ